MRNIRERDRDREGETEREWDRDRDRGMSKSEVRGVAGLTYESSPSLQTQKAVETPSACSSDMMEFPFASLPSFVARTASTPSLLTHVNVLAQFPPPSMEKLVLRILSSG
eukprot:764141-Hanusia_phi.AAC.5